MSASESPMIARRRVRIALREAREAKRLTQSDVAEAMEWSLSKVIRIEGGEVSISPNDLRPLLTFLGIRDRAAVDSLIAAAKTSRTRQRRFWWQDERFRDHMTQPMQRLIEFEREAVAIRYFSVNIVPGPLQTPMLAEAIVRQWQHFGLSDADAEARLALRLRRRDEIFDRPDAPRISVVLDESLTLRPYGGRGVLINQLEHLEQLAAEGRIQLRILPFASEFPLPVYSSFDIFHLQEPENDAENAVIYHESDFLDEIVEDAKRVEQFNSRFEELWNASLPEGDTITLLRTRLKQLVDKHSTSVSV